MTPLARVAGSPSVPEGDNRSVQVAAYRLGLEVDNPSALVVAYPLAPAAALRLTVTDHAAWIHEPCARFRPLSAYIVPKSGAVP